MFRTAIVRTPCPEMIQGITTSTKGTPDYERAMAQHDRYVSTLRSLGLEVSVLDPDSRFPDSTFVEDVALCTSAMAVITSPGASSRKGETAGMEAVLASVYEHIEHIVSPGALDAGDVMMTGSHFYIGISGRTNPEGAEQLIHILERYGMTGETVEIKDMLHLKSGVSYLENDHLLTGDELSDHPAFRKYKKIRVGKGEDYAANSLWINGTVLVPQGFPETRTHIEEAGFTTIALDVSEFEKLDGGLSCLSLRF